MNTQAACTTRVSADPADVLLRLLVVTDHPSPHMRDLLRELSRDERLITRTYYLANGNPSRLWDQAVHQGTYYIGRTNPPRLWGIPVTPDLRLRRVVKQFDPDVVCLSSTYLEPTIQFLAIYLSKKRRQWFLYNEGIRPQRGGFAARVLKSMLLSTFRSADGAISIGAKSKFLYQDLIGPGKPIAVGGYYEDLSGLRAVPRSGAAGLPLRIVYFGRLLALKRLDLILDALAALDHSAFTFDVYGEGPELNRLAAHASARQVNVTFHPWAPFAELPRILSRYDCFVMASEADGWGMVVPEAMAAGLAVLVRETVGAADLVRPGESGLLLPASDAAFVTELRKCLIALAANPGEVRRFGTQGREAAARFTPAAGAEIIYSMALSVLRNARTQERYQPALHPSLGTRARQIIKGILAYPPRNPTPYRGLRVVVYHTVDITSTGSAFSDQLNFFRDHYHIVNLAELEDCLAAENGLAITVDDCYRTTVESIAGAFAKCAIRATFFMPTCALADDFRATDSFWFARARLHTSRREVAGADTLVSLARAGHGIESHGHSHIRFAELSEAQMRAELRKSKQILETLTGQRVTHVAYPYGSVPPPSAIETLQSEGYRYGWTVRRGINDPFSQRFYLRRDHLEGDWPVRVARLMLSRA